VRFLLMSLTLMTPPEVSLLPISFPFYYSSSAFLFPRPSFALLFALCCCCPSVVPYLHALRSYAGIPGWGRAG